MTFDPTERAFIGDQRVGRLATVDDVGQPHAVPICYATVGDTLVSPIDVKPQRVAPESLKRVRNLRTNPRASVIIDRYTESWDELAWVRIDGAAEVVGPTNAQHGEAVTALQEKYEQYATHPLADRPAIAVAADHVASWGAIEKP